MTKTGIFVRPISNKIEPNFILNRLIIKLFQANTGARLKTERPILSASLLCKKFSNFTAVTDFDLSLKPGEIFGILGPNGAGKTTIIRMLLGLIKPSSGEVVINGFSLSGNFVNAIKNIGCLVETPFFYNYLSGRENLELLFKISNPKLNPHQDVEQTLKLVKLFDRADDTVKKYSQGMRQRLGIAAAILHKPKIVILDEPTNGLDPEGMIEIRKLILSMANNQNISFLISSHLLSEIEQLCHRIAILNLGKTIAMGSVSQLIQPGDDNLEDLFLRLIKTKK